MRVIYEAGNLLDGHLVKGLLEQRGIPAFVSGQYLTGALGGLQVAGEVTAALLEDRRAFEDASADDAAACDEGEA